MTSIRPAQEIGTDGVTTNWVPFTTPGPPLLACSSSFYYQPDQPAARAIAFDPYYGQEIDPLVRCLPAEATLWWFQHVKPESSKININFGPFSCPNGYTTATTSAINPITILVACCPSYAGTIMPPASIGQCNSTLVSSQTVVVKDRGKGNVWTDSTTRIPGDGSEIQGVHMNGYIFRDEATTSTISSSSIPASASAFTTSISPTLTDATVSTSPSSTSSFLPSPPNLKSEGLSQGGRIGVGVGVSLGLVGLISMLVAFILFKRRDRSPNEQGVAENGPESKPLQPTGSIAPNTEMSSDLQRDPSEMWVTPENGAKPETPRAELSAGS